MLFTSFGLLPWHYITPTLCVTDENAENPAIIYLYKYISFINLSKYEKCPFYLFFFKLKLYV